SEAPVGIPARHVDRTKRTVEADHPNGLGRSARGLQPERLDAGGPRDRPDQPHPLYLAAVQLQAVTAGAMGASSEFSVNTPFSVCPRTDRMNVLPSSRGSVATLSQKVDQTPS